MSDYRKSHLAPEKGKAYQASFSENPFRAMVWELERRILDRAVREFLPGVEIRHLDVACGTGRILGHFREQAIESVGIDIAPGMLAVAREQCAGSELIEGDFTGCAALSGRRFNLITAFRFFPNAEPELRKATMAEIAAHLETGGCCIFNNHRNLSSTRYRLARLLGRGGLDGMSRDEAENLVMNAGLEIAQIYHLNVLPASERYTLLPVSVLVKAEQALSGISWLRDLGENLIYVCRQPARLE